MSAVFAAIEFVTKGCTDGLAVRVAVEVVADEVAVAELPETIGIDDVIAVAELPETIGIVAVADLPETIGIDDVVAVAELPETIGIGTEVAVA
jgi:uncharacterized protein with GYD domain